MNYSTLRGLGTYCQGRCSAANFLAKALFAMLFMVFAFQFEGKAQGVAYPSCNISGPLEAVASGPDITINVEVAHSTANPTINYEFSSNSSNAFIRTKGPVVYSPSKNAVTQKLIVCPGNQGSGFNLKLEVTTPNGVSRCSKSVSVSSSAASSTSGN